MNKSTDPAPPYDPTRLDKYIREVQHSMDVSSPNPLSLDLVQNLQHSQLTSLSLEINASMQDTLQVQKRFTEQLQSMARLQEESEGDVGVEILAQFDDCHKNYNKMLWKARELATALAGSNGLDGFSNVFVYGLLKDSDVPDDVVIAELANFVQHLPSHQASDASLNFTDINDGLAEVIVKIEAMLGPLVQETRIKELQERLSETSIQYRNMLPECLKSLGFDEKSSVVWIYVSLAPGALIRSLPGQDKRTAGSANASAVAKAHKEVQELTNELKIARQELKDMKSQQRTIAARWHVALISATMLRQDLIDIEHDCTDYVDFLQGPKRQNPEARTQIVARLEESSKLYSHLGEALKRFANAVVPSPAVRYPK
ncbi:hypothetical protein RhiJN_22447 [Ceratobasidium sp. AG-Ba]|nr:hypothetical protein RhiJN_22447 [Ceratobasidium sp. AG-Ba]